MTRFNSKDAVLIEEKPMPRARKSGDGAAKPREIIEDRLYSISLDNFGAEHLLGITVLVNMSEDKGASDSKVPLVLTWCAEDNIDERIFEGIVRMCSSSMKGVDQKVLLIGSQDAIDTVAACIIREYLGCSAGTAFTIMRDGNSGCLQKRELMETVLSFRPS